MRLFILALSLSLSACAAQRPGYWDHPSKDRALFDRDRAQCLYESAAATAGSTSPYLMESLSQDVTAGVRRADLLVLCMQARGYMFVQP